MQPPRNAKKKAGNKEAGQELFDQEPSQWSMMSDHKPVRSKKKKPNVLYNDDEEEDHFNEEFIPNNPFPKRSKSPNITDPTGLSQ